MQPLYMCFIENILYQTLKVSSIMVIRADLGAGQYHFPGATGNPILHRIDNFGNRQAILPAAHHRYNAIGTEIITTILDFY